MGWRWLGWWDATGNTCFMSLLTDAAWHAWPSAISSRIFWKPPCVEELGRSTSSRHHYSLSCSPLHSPPNTHPKHVPPLHSRPLFHGLGFSPHRPRTVVNLDLLFCLLIFLASRPPMQFLLHVVEQHPASSNQVFVDADPRKESRDLRISSY